MSPGLSPSHVATGDPIMGKGNEDPMPGIAIWGEQILGTWEGGVNHNEQNQGLNPELPSPRPPRYSGKQPWQGSSYTLLAQFPPPPRPHSGLLINRGFQHLDVTCLRHAPSGPSFERTSDPAHPFQSASPAQSQARELFVPLLIMCPPASAFPGCPQGRVLSELLLSGQT